jgi:protein SCO1
MRFVVALCLVLVVGCSRAGSSLDTSELRGIGIDQRLGHAIPKDAAFRDETGRSVALGDYLGGRPIILALVYNRCPMLCNMTLSGLVGALKAVELAPGRDFDVIAASFDPKEPAEVAAAQKHRYVERYGRPGAEDAFHFLTGDAGSIAELTEAVGFRYEWDEELQQWAHPAALIVLTPDGRIARYFYGTEFSPRDLRFALVEASDGKVGRLTDQLLLLCYRYDPQKGSYSASALGAVRIGGAFTALGLGAFIVTSVLRERRRRRNDGAGGKS